MKRQVLNHPLRETVMVGYQRPRQLCGINVPFALRRAICIPRRVPFSKDYCTRYLLSFFKLFQRNGRSVLRYFQARVS
jgi:hypothetical protein